MIVTSKSKNTWTKIQVLELKVNTNFKGLYSDLERYIFDIVLRVTEMFYRMVKELKQYLGMT